MLWPLVARAVYRELLDLSWDVGGLPADATDLREIVRASSEEWKRAWPYIERKFPLGEDGLRRNPRLEVHREAAQQMRAAKSAGAAKTNAKRWGSRTHNESLSESDSDSHSESLSDHLSESPPAPAPAPAPRFKSPSETRPLPRTPKAKPAYERQEFHSDVVSAYHEALPDLPPVKTWSDRRRKALNARIRERIAGGKPADTLEYWRAFFESVSASDFLTGKSTGWRADLEWLLRPENFLKVIEGRYENRSATESRGAIA